MGERWKKWTTWTGMRKGRDRVNDTVRVSHEEYRRQFGVVMNPNDLTPLISKVEAEAVARKRLSRALEQAYEARKFEIDMYWKRATYFWAFIASAFVGYASFLGGEHPRAFPALLMSQVGLIFSVAWHRANRGSKFWQENWENHVDLLEDAVTGPLYKTITERPHKPTDEPRWIDRRVGPSKLSVSKINGIISLYVIVIWIELTVGAGVALWSNEIHALLHAWDCLSAIRIVVSVLMLVPTAVFLRYLFIHADTHIGPHRSVIWQRVVQPTDPVAQKPVVGSKPLAD